MIGMTDDGDGGVAGYMAYLEDEETGKSKPC